MSISASVPSPRARIFVWTGAVLFAASLLYFLYTYFVTLAETASLSGRAGVAIVENVVLFSVFALHHSVFARDTLRARIMRAVGPKLERSVYVWVASLLFIAVCALWQPVPGLVWRLTGVTAWIAGLVQLFGVWLTLRSAVIIDVLELAGVRHVSSTVSPRSSEFKTIGPYGWVRHPIYLGWVLLVFATSTMTMSRMVFAATSSVYLVIAIPLEERTLRMTAGDSYREYMRRVPWRLVPRVY